jgi:hypothetical protein
MLVASPALFQVQCKTPQQMELATTFGRYLEMAQLVQGSRCLTWVAIENRDAMASPSNDSKGMYFRSAQV